MSKPNLPEESVEEFRRVFSEQEGNWKRDNAGVFRIQESKQGPTEHISFPSSVYGRSEVDLDSFWVYCRAKLVIRALRKYNVKTIWEIGAGDGRVAIPVSQAGIKVIASEPYYEGAKILAKNNILVCQASLSKLGLKDEVLSNVGMFDVLEHIENINGFLQEVSRVVKPESLLFVTVPAHEWLLSDFDYAIGHFRRYSKKSLINDLGRAGFKPVEVRYFFASLVIPAYLLRRIPYILRRRRLFNGEGSSRTVTEARLSPTPAINKIMRLVLALDSSLKLPVGLSLLGVFKKT